MDVLSSIGMGALGGLVGTAIVCVPYALWLHHDLKKRRKS